MSIAIASGGTALLAQVGRKFGKQKEAELFQTWGGKPTTPMLRHQNSENKVALERKHRKLQQLISDLHIPTPQEELDDARHADEVYKACIANLIGKTRNSEEFPLIFIKNSMLVNLTQQLEPKCLGE